MNLFNWLLPVLAADSPLISLNTAVETAGMSITINISTNILFMLQSTWSILYITNSHLANAKDLILVDIQKLQNFEACQQ
jgi:hypothetical protein